MKDGSDEEFFKKLDEVKGAKTRRNIRKLAGKSADELFEVAMRKVAGTAKEER